MQNNTLSDFNIEQAIISDGLSLTKLLVMSELCESESNAEQLIEKGMCLIDNDRITYKKYIVSNADFINGTFILKAGNGNRKRINLI